MFTKKIKHCLLSTGIIIATVLANPIAMLPMAATPVEVQAAEAPTVEPRVDEIVWIFRVNNGQRQKRRWNRTRGYWVDPDWINY